MLPKPHHGDNAAPALVAVAPLVTRWIDRLLAAHDPPLSLAQFLALRAVASEALSASELARRTGVSGPAVSQLLSALADAGLIERAELAQDRRRHTLTLTARGEKVLATAQARLNEGIASLLTGLPAPERDALARGLGQVEAKISGTPPPRRPLPPPDPPRPVPRHRR